jgi:hypothetical protein
LLGAKLALQRVTKYLRDGHAALGCSVARAIEQPFISLDHDPLDAIMIAIWL